MSRARKEITDEKYVEIQECFNRCAWHLNHGEPELARAAWEQARFAGYVPERGHTWEDDRQLLTEWLAGGGWIGGD